MKTPRIEWRKTEHSRHICRLAIVITVRHSGSAIDKPRVRASLCFMPNAYIHRTGALLAGILSITINAGAADRLEPGLIGEYFQMEAGLENFPTIEPGRKPSLSRTDKDINFASTTEEFAGTRLRSEE